jgi:hypothetical protein
MAQTTTDGDLMNIVDKNAYEIEKSIQSALDCLVNNNLTTAQKELESSRDILIEERKQGRGMHIPYISQSERINYILDYIDTKCKSGSQDH